MKEIFEVLANIFTVSVSVWASILCLLYFIKTPESYLLGIAVGCLIWFIFKKKNKFSYALISSMFVLGYYLDGVNHPDGGMRSKLIWASFSATIIFVGFVAAKLFEIFGDAVAKRMH